MISLGQEYSNINQHMRVVHKTIRSGKNEKVKCLECNGLYYDIQQHMRRTHKHPVVREFYCFTCGHKFTKQANLRRHEQRIHLGMKYECLICEKVVADIDKHMQIHRESSQSLEEILAAHNIDASTMQPKQQQQQQQTEEDQAGQEVFVVPDQAVPETGDGETQQQGEGDGMEGEKEEEDEEEEEEVNHEKDEALLPIGPQVYLVEQQPQLQQEASPVSDANKEQ